MVYEDLLCYHVRHEEATAAAAILAEREADPRIIHSEDVRGRSKYKLHQLYLSLAMSLSCLLYTSDAAD